MERNNGMNRDWPLRFMPAMGSSGNPTPPFKVDHPSLQFMPSMAPEKPLAGGGRSDNPHHNHPALMAAMNGGMFHHRRACGVSEAPILMDYMSDDAWINHTDKYINNHHNDKYINNHHSEKYISVLPEALQHHPSYGVLSESSAPEPIQRIQQSSFSKNETLPEMEEVGIEGDDGGRPKKRSAGKVQKSPKPKKAKRASRAAKDECSPSVQRARAPKRSAEVVINGVDMDISSIPIPVCSCTGTHQQCYRWGSGGWQSACCTTGISMYPLPMSTKRRGARIAGRKMSLGAFKKVLEKLASEDYNFNNAIDLRAHWAKHGTNKFVTIK